MICSRHNDSSILNFTVLPSMLHEDEYILSGAIILKGQALLEADSTPLKILKKRNYIRSLVINELKNIIDELKDELAFETLLEGDLNNED